jgi:hypothetical protein
MSGVLESGLVYVYLRARYYDPATGQFINHDPLSGLTKQPYTYASDNPLNATDPTGALTVGSTISAGDASYLEFLGVSPAQLAATPQFELIDGKWVYGGVELFSQMMDQDSRGLSPGAQLGMVLHFLWNDLGYQKCWNGDEAAWVDWLMPYGSGAALREGPAQAAVR